MIICIYLQENVQPDLAIGKKRYNCDVFQQLLPHQSIHSKYRKSSFFIIVACAVTSQ